MEVFETLANGAAAGRDFGGLILREFAGLLRGEDWRRKSESEDKGGGEN